MRNEKRLKMLKHFQPFFYIGTGIGKTVLRWKNLA